MAISVVPTGFSDVRIKPESGTVSAFLRAQGGDNFILEAARENVKNYVRHGDDLIIEFDDGQRLTIKDFFAQGGDYHNLILESAGIQHFVDFAQALRDEDVDKGDGIEEAMIRHHPVHQGDTNIDYDTIVSSIDAGNKGKEGSFSNLFSGKSFVSVLGGLGAIGAVAEYAYSSDDSDGMPDPFADVPTPEALLPPPPNENEAGAEVETTDIDLRFFTSGAHLIETRIVKADNVAFNSKFFMPLVIDGQGEAAPAHPLLYHVFAADTPLYLGVFAKTAVKLDVGERLQLRANNGQWQDAAYDAEMDAWRFSADPMVDDLYLVESRIVNAQGDFLRQGATLSPSDLYSNLSDLMKGNMPPIARIDYTQHGDRLYDMVKDADNIAIGGKVIGKFEEGYKIQIRVGGGWYDAILDGKNADGSYSWHYVDMPTLVSSRANDNIQLESNTQDTIIYHLLDDKDATGGNGADKINNFKIGQWGDADVDRIDIASLLIGYNPALPLYADGGLSHYISVLHDGEGNSEIRLDRDGIGTMFEGTVLLFTLMGVETSLEALYNNGQLIVS